MAKLKFTDIDKEIYFFIVNHKIEYQNGPTLQEIVIKKRRGFYIIFSGKEFYCVRWNCI